ncbi:hypothetical protein NA63_2052 [Flavobacteriaceae bacterium MAR_2010_105]|nr:hypothetical protein NA63_2052 [Flavobacteriaceae bacterium MAR_2010_105]
MKNTMLLLVCALLSINATAQSCIGAWERYFTNEQGENLKSVVLFADGYQVISTYNADTGTFLSTNGGTWKLKGDIMTEKVEFHTDDDDLIGTEASFQIVITETTLEIVGSSLKFNKIDDGTPGELRGAWLMSGRFRDGNEQLRDTSGPRKTMKILSGTRFQWIAYNIETKQFMGTGGGKYTTIDGKYTETIAFFSRDDSKVGLSLQFDYDLIDGKWHHKGFSSKGEPLHEIWSVREK